MDQVGIRGEQTKGGGVREEGRCGGRREFGKKYGQEGRNKGGREGWGGLGMGGWAKCEGRRVRKVRGWEGRWI